MVEKHHSGAASITSQPVVIRYTRRVIVSAEAAASDRDKETVMIEPPSPLRMLFSRHTRRRELITLLGSAASWPLMVRAQPSMSTSERMTDPCQPAIDGTWKNLATDFRHTPDPTGVANSSPALDDWLTFARRQGSTPVKLYIPPGTYKLSGTNGFTNGVKDATVSAWRVTVDNLGIGTFNVLPQDYNHSECIQTVNAGRD